MTTQASEDNAVHIAVIRKALGDGNAAVMVGSGFSRNAEGGEQLRLWPDIARALWKELNPHEEAAADFLGTQGPQLGEQFVRVFSTPVLEDLLKRLVPDEKVRPGRLHMRLLELPWSDIFTTNYDTLIERAADSILDRAHYTIACREDIPQSKILNRRRIVKLHGSFPSQRPFIFTEEDYRRYPQAFAPFVNLVRQSLLENVFCLIGFSGDDPNFLHWIGWIRDMLDQHALPIYLFLPEEPSLGQRALLHARRVTPVVLPCPQQVDPKDFAGRFAALFDQLDKPTNPLDTEWATIDRLHDGKAYGTTQLAEGYDVLLTQFAALRTFRRCYPGWLIAPRKARLHMEASLHRLAVSLDRRDLYRFLSERAPLTSLVLAEQYGWQQDVLLQCWNDHIAEDIMVTLRRVLADDRHALFAKEADALIALDVETVASLMKTMGRLVRQLLRWAREGCQRDRFAEFEAMLATWFSEDSSLQADLYLENVLLSLYEGEVDVARRALLDWDVASLESYMAVRRGALLAEVGEVELGLSFCTDALIRLRQNQRVRADTTRYLSEEAWACRVIGALQNASKVHQKGREGRWSNSEDIDRRLVQLATKGHDVGQQLNEIIGDLGKDARVRRDSRYRRTAFDAGHFATGQSFGFSSQLEQKISAGFAWLTLIDRVGLPPRIGETTFEIDTFLQAGWWIRLYDSPRRMLSVAIRGQRSKVLDPRDEGQLDHNTGWLSRAYVAGLSPEIAHEISERSLGLVERMLGAPLSEQQVERLAEFHLEVVSRLIIRLESQDQAEAIVRRVIELHSDRRFCRLHDAWKSGSHAVSRGFEVLDDAAALRMLILLMDAPLVPNEVDADHYTSRWLRFSEVDLPDARNTRQSDFSQIVPRLLATAMGTDASSEKMTQINAWQRLFGLEESGYLNARDKAEIGRSLWSRANPVPRIPGYEPFAFLRWPAPKGIDKHKVLRGLTLAKALPSLTTGGSMTLRLKDSDHGWGIPADNRLLTTWFVSMRDHRWPRTDAIAAVRIIRTWWELDWEVVCANAPKSDDIMREVQVRWELIDRIFSAIVGAEVGRKPSRAWRGTLTWIDLAVSQAQALTPSFWRFRAERAVAEDDHRALTRVEAEVCTTLISESDESLARLAANFVFDRGRRDGWIPAQIVSVLVSQFASLSVDGLRRATPLLTMIASKQPDWLSEPHRCLVETAATLGQSRLSYGNEGELEPDSVPWLRRLMAGLLYCWRAAFPARMTAELDAWLNELARDPLPEVRREATGR